MSVLIILTGLWSAYGASEHVLNPLIEATDTVWNTLFGWMFIPFGAYSALKVSTCFCHLALKHYTVPIIFILPVRQMWSSKIMTCRTKCMFMHVCG
jgi:hypothetical protein